jgi:long-subunit fatty acid transport protein
MLPRPSAAAAAAVVLTLAAAPATPQVLIPLTRSGSGARAAGMANAFVALSDDGTAASWNPAGLAQLRKAELSFVYGVNERGLRFTGQRSPDDRFVFTNRDLEYATSSPDFASLALPFEVARKPVTFQLGWQRLYPLEGRLEGETVRVPVEEADGPPSTVAIHNDFTGQIDLVSLSAAVKLTGRLSLGGSLNTWRGKWTSQATITEREDGDFVSAFTREQVRGHNFTGGLLLTYPSWNAGFVYHSPFWSDYERRTEVQSSRAPTETTESGGSGRFRFPRNLALGVAWRPGVHWTLAVDLNHDQWTEMVVDRVRDRPGLSNYFDDLPPELSLTRDTLSLSLGAEHLFPREGFVVPLRMGFAWEPQGAMDLLTRDPVEYFLLSAGTGYNTNRLKFDLGVQYRWAAFEASDVLSVDTATEPGLVRDAVGRVGAHEWRFKLSMIYRLSSAKKVPAASLAAPVRLGYAGPPR